MKRIVVCLVFICTCFIQAKAQEPESSLLWEISGNGLKQPSWIFGTFHLICKDDFTISDILKTRIKAVASFYGELKMDDPNMLAVATKRMMMPEGSLETMIGEKDYSAVSNAFSKIMGPGGTLKFFDHFKPMMAQSMLLTRMVSCDDPIQPETEFVKIAAEYKIPIHGLETIDDQMDALDTQPLDSQVTDLKKTILNFDSAKNIILQMTRVYQRRNIDSIYHFIGSNDPGGVFEMNMVINRNKNWVPLIEKASAAESVFYAVGAGHLGGTEGVINLLRKRGYTLTPVKY